MMNKRQQKLKKLYDHSAQLTPKNAWYRVQLHRYLLEGIREDITQDITTNRFVGRYVQAEAVIVSHATGKLAGMQELRWAAQQLHLDVKVGLADGHNIIPDQIVARLAGKARTLFAAERTLLNVVQRMSGIATSTNTLVQQCTKSIAICATRKTLFGGLDKRAVSIGGGLTHRLGLGDGVLVKDNHLAVLPKLTDLKKIHFSKRSSRTIEITSLAQLKTVVTLLLDYDVIMFDNFTPLKIKQAITWLRQQGLYQRYLLEASGGITPETIKQFSSTGVDAVSLGCLTHSVRSLDLSLEIYHDAKK